MPSTHRGKPGASRSRVGLATWMRPRKSHRTPATLSSSHPTPRLLCPTGVADKNVACRLRLPFASGRCAVLCSRHDPSPIRTETRAEHRRLMRHRFAQWTARHRIPEASSFLAGRRHRQNPPAIGTEARHHHRLLVNESHRLAPLARWRDELGGSPCARIRALWDWVIRNRGACQSWVCIPDP